MTALAPADIAAGDLLDLGEHCPPRCVTWSTDGTCWGLTRDTRRKPRRPGTVVYRVVAPVDDPEAWTDGPEGPRLALAGAAGEPPGLPPAPPAAGDPTSPDPVERVRAVFPGAVVEGDTADLALRVWKLLDAQGRRDPGSLAEAVWSRLAAAVDGGDPHDLLVATRAVIAWCETAEPERLSLGGWKRLVGLVEGFEFRARPRETRLAPWTCLCPEEERVPKEPCRQHYHTES